MTSQQIKEARQKIEDFTMETVDFYPKTFQEIPEQDNPAFGDDECLMIVKESDTCPHSVIHHISEENRKNGDAVVHIAKFWRHDLALKYCEKIRAIRR